jgi:hypothetical protein
MRPSRNLCGLTTNKCPISSHPVSPPVEIEARPPSGRRKPDPWADPGAIRQDGAIVGEHRRRSYDEVHCPSTHIQPVGPCCQ